MFVMIYLRVHPPRIG